MSQSIFCFFLKYLEEVQEINKNKFSKQAYTKCLFLAVKVKRYDKFFKSADYNFCAGFENVFSFQPQIARDTFSKIAICFYYDERYYLSILNFNKHNIK